MGIIILFISIIIIIGLIIMFYLKNKKTIKPKSTDELEISTEISTEIETTSELEISTEIETTSELEISTEISTEIETTSELEISTEIETTSELEISTEIESDKIKYIIGCLSDLHYDMYDTKNSEYLEDMKNAFKYFYDNNVNSIMSSGDIVQYQDEEFKEFYNIYKPYFDKGIRFYTCLGNHDYLRLYDNGVNKEQLWQKNVADLHCIKGVTSNIEADINFFEYGAKWNDPQRTGTRNAHSKQNYWINIKGDIYVFLSVDYKEENGSNSGLSQAINLLNKNNSYVKQMKDYVKDTPYNEVKEKNFDYRFYDPEVLIWLKDILEANINKRVFIFTHHFFPQKAGNGNSLNGKWFYSQLRVWPYTTNTAINQRYYAGSNTLCGLEFWFLNKLNNLYKNSYWFSGHSHIRFNDNIYQKDIIFCDDDYDIVKPDGKESVILVDDIWALRQGPYDYKRYTRLNDKSISKCGLNIHLPSVSKPLTISDTSAKTLYGASEGMLIEVWEKKVVFKTIIFKEEGSYEYINKILQTKEY